MSIKQVAAADLALHGGIPVRSKDSPLPTLFPRAIAAGAKENVARVLDSGFTFNMIAEFERVFAKTMGAKYAIGLSNCTDALHAVVAGLGVGPGDEVIVSPITDYGSVKGVLVQGATPVFPDVDLDTGLITAEHIEPLISPRTKAIIAVHFYGLLCDMDPIVELARRHDLVLIEDVCQAPLAEYKGRKAGTIGDVGCFSLEAEKHLSTDHGGMAISDDQALIDAIRFVAISRGARPAPQGTRTHEVVGHTFRYGHLEAAVGLAQIEDLPAQIRRRVELAGKLSAKLRAIEGVSPPHVPSERSHVYWLYHVKFHLERFDVGVAEIVDALNAEGLKCGPAMYYLIPYSHTFLPDREAILDRLPNARSHLTGVVRWPWTDTYADRDLEDIAAIVGKVANAYRKR